MNEERRAKRRAQFREWYARNREAQLVRMKAYREANPDVCKAACKAWVQANPEKRAGYDKTKRARHYPKIKQRQDAWRRANPDKIAVQSAAAVHKRRARKQANGGNITAADVKALRQTADGLCAYCLKPCAKLVVEHCIPLSRGGSNTIDNCVMACQTCNSRKHDKTPLEFLCNLPRLGRFDGNHPIQSD